MEAPKSVEAPGQLPFCPALVQALPACGGCGPASGGCCDPDSPVTLHVGDMALSAFSKEFSEIAQILCKIYTFYNYDLWMNE